MGRLSEYDDDDLVALGLRRAPGDILARPKEPYSAPTFRGLTLDEVASMAHHASQQRAEAWLIANAPQKTEPCACPEPLDYEGDDEETLTDAQAAE